MGETRGHYSKKYLVVSQTEPVNPADGLLWYKPDLCLTTTTTTSCMECYNAPAPLNITLTPDAVGSNPVTWYWKCFYHRMIYTPQGEYRSLFSTWESLIIGDSTTKITIGGMDKPYWANALNFLFSTTDNDTGITYLSYDDVMTYPGETVLIMPFVYYYYETYLETTYIEAIKQVSDCFPDWTPKDIIITPDTIGNNPIIWYYKLLYMEGDFVTHTLHYTISELTEESSFTIGDDTTEIIVTGVNTPCWATGLCIILGTTSGNYPYAVPGLITSSPQDIFGNYINVGYGNLEPVFLLNFKINEDSCECNQTTPTTTQPI